MAETKAADAADAGARLDERDVVLLEALRCNARESLASLARRINLSRSAAGDRLRRLERSGIIAGYTLRLRETMPTSSTAFLTVTFASGTHCPDVVPSLRAISEIIACDSLAGSPDLILRVACRSNSALEGVRARIADVQGIATVSTHVILEQHWSQIEVSGVVKG